MRCMKLLYEETFKMSTSYSLIFSIKSLHFIEDMRY